MPDNSSPSAQAPIFGEKGGRIGVWAVPLLGYAEIMRVVALFARTARTVALPARLVQRTCDRLAYDLGIAAPIGGFAHRLRPFHTPSHKERLHLRAFGIDHPAIGHGGAHHTGMIVGKFADCRQRRGDALLKAAACDAPHLHMAVELLPRLFDKGQKTGALVGIMQIESAVSQTCFARNILWPRRIITALDKKFARGLTQPDQTLRFAAPIALAFNNDNLPRHNSPVPATTFRARRKAVNV